MQSLAKNCGYHNYTVLYTIYKMPILGRIECFAKTNCLHPTERSSLNNVLPIFRHLVILLDGNLPYLTIDLIWISSVVCWVMGRLLDLGVIGNYGTPPNDTTQNTGYRQLAPGTGCRSPA